MLHVSPQEGGTYNCESFKGLKTILVFPWTTLKLNKGVYMTISLEYDSSYSEWLFKGLINIFMLDSPICSIYSLEVHI
jgi:hypothetical protein